MGGRQRTTLFMSKERVQRESTTTSGEERGKRKEK
jgi:hypothetical protein